MDWGPAMPCDSSSSDTTTRPAQADITATLVRTGRATRAGLAVPRGVARCSTNVRTAAIPSGATIQTRSTTTGRSANAPCVHRQPNHSAPSDAGANERKSKRWLTDGTHRAIAAKAVSVVAARSAKTPVDIRHDRVGIDRPQEGVGHRGERERDQRDIDRALAPVTRLEVRAELVAERQDERHEEDEEGEIGGSRLVAVTADEVGRQERERADPDQQEEERDVPLRAATRGPPAAPGRRRSARSPRTATRTHVLAHVDRGAALRTAPPTRSRAPATPAPAASGRGRRPPWVQGIMAARRPGRITQPGESEDRRT